MEKKRGKTHHAEIVGKRELQSAKRVKGRCPLRRCRGRGAPCWVWAKPSLPSAPSHVKDVRTALPLTRRPPQNRCPTNWERHGQRMAAADSLLHAAYGCKWLPSAYSAYCFPRLRRGKDVMLRLGFAQTQQRLLASALSGGASPRPPFSRSAVPFSLQFARVRPFSLAFPLHIC